MALPSTTLNSKMFYLYKKQETTPTLIPIMSIPVLMAPSLLNSSVRSTVTLVHSIVGPTTFELDAHLETVSIVRTYHHKHSYSICTAIFSCRQINHCS